MYELLKNLNNLLSLVCIADTLTTCKSIVDIICNNLKNLHSLSISWACLESSHIIQITDNLKNLNSIEISTNMQIGDGLNYLSKISRPLKKFGLFHNNLSHIEDFK